MPASKRDLFKAGEVCEMAQVQPYVLRSWEAEFPRLGRPADQSGTRTYHRGDVELVLRIKQLVFGEGLTLAGARRRLEEEEEDERPTTSAAALAMRDALDDMARTRLRQIRSGLEEILAIVGPDRHHGAPELQLVPPDDRRGHGAALKTGAKAAARSAEAARRSATTAAAKAGAKRRPASR